MTSNNFYRWISLYAFMAAVFFLIVATISSDCNEMTKCLQAGKVKFGDIENVDLRDVADCNQVETFWK